jgi:D-alanine-D-alanine ligase
MKKHVALLKGGKSRERQISLQSAKNISASLKRLGYKVTEIDTSCTAQKLIKALTPKPDIIFNGLHGKYGEDGIIQGLMEFLKIPYTHSGVLASALAMNKYLSKLLLSKNGFLCPKGKLLNIGELLKNKKIKKPYVIKPINEGSSIGVHIIRNEQQLKSIEKKWKFGEKILMEEYIEGQEITVAVMGKRALGALEIVTKKEFYNFGAKYSDPKTKHIVPAPLPSKEYNLVLKMALKAHNLIGCSGASRVDFRYCKKGINKGKFFILEVNTQPGMTNNSLFPEIAAYHGISFDEIVEWMIKNASLTK